MTTISIKFHHDQQQKRIANKQTRRDEISSKKKNNEKSKGKEDNNYSTTTLFNEVCQHRTPKTDSTVTLSYISYNLGYPVSDFRGF